ncbi:S8 family peptidase [Flavobacterium turcicum]|uniref:S8 family serine peptidase n=1 Tax=Flavobacterium turcicum TaxID=2764718 RepID=A0ABR7JE04_9FLAO|nr:S8 family peptidase [Flavobacterium turcicum]MBC5862723.1 S8 family serine peptidase [Flavobacterium turcicum]NHL01455.1 S8 family serine peptidase [Flavobacterium turcicum]
MNFKIIIALLFIPLISFSQKTDRWKHLLTTTDQKKPSTYFLTTVSNALTNKYKIIKQLDSQFCIIPVSNEPSEKFKEQIYRVNNDWKLPEQTLKKNRKNNFNLSTSNTNLLQATLNKLQIAHKIVGDMIMLRTDLQTIQEHILPLPFVLSITTESFTPTLESKIRDQNLTVNQINGLSEKFPLVDGATQIISIKDDLFDTADIDLLGKYITSSSESAQVGAHATAMATIAAGLGNSSALGKGVAPKAKLQSSNFNSLFPDPINSLQGVTVQNHSYGTTIENFYGLLANAYDKNSFENTSLNHVFSAGNRGTEGYKTITGNFKNSKNSIVVGCVDTNEQIMPFSSKGPANDGRIKPEIVAYSTEGTSNSAAITTGVIALMNELHTAKNKLPLRNDTAKAILINSAKDLGNKGPDFTYGFGNINATKCLNTINENRIILGKIGSMQTNTHQIELPASAKNLKISLVWTDPEAPANSTFCLVNDLDLSLNSTTENELPWVLNAANPAAPATKAPDHLNTIEQIELANPQEQTYTLTVKSQLLQNDFQNYSIVYDYESADTFEWLYPKRNDNFPFDGKNPSPFKWKTNQTNTNGTLSISFDDGLSWTPIQNNIDIQNQRYLYAPAQPLFEQAKLKMKINEREYLSDSFILSYDLNVTTTLVCNGITEITWSTPPAVTAFNIYTLRNSSLQFKEQITTNTYTFTDATNYTVAPVFKGIEGIKSESTVVTRPNTDCYFESTLAEIESENQIKISASLFSLFQIKKIEILKTKNNQETSINTILNINSKTITVTDDNPEIGINRYFIRLTLIDGTVFDSSVFETNYYFEQLFLVTPTLVQKDNKLLIEAKSEGTGELQLFNSSGQLMQTNPISSKSSEITLINFTSGVYIYKLITAKGETQTGKLIKI